MIYYIQKLTQLIFFIKLIFNNPPFNNNLNGHEGIKTTRQISIHSP